MKKSDRQSESFFDLILKQAMLAAEEPEDQREVYLQALRSDNFRDAMQAGNSKGQAKEIADQMDVWVRDAIRVQMQGGGSTGGHA